MNEKEIEEVIDFFKDTPSKLIFSRNKFELLLSCAAVCLEILGMEEEKKEKIHYLPQTKEEGDFLIQRMIRNDGYNQCLNEIQQLIKKEI